jgi:hypothetical protein
LYLSSNWLVQFHCLYDRGGEEKDPTPVGNLTPLGEPAASHWLSCPSSFWNTRWNATSVYLPISACLSSRPSIVKFLLCNIPYSKFKQAYVRFACFPEHFFFFQILAICVRSYEAWDVCASNPEVESKAVCWAHRSTVRFSPSCGILLENIDLQFEVTHHSSYRSLSRTRLPTYKLDAVAQLIVAIFASRVCVYLLYTGQFKKKVTLSDVCNEVTSVPTITRYTTVVRKTLKVCNWRGKVFRAAVARGDHVAKWRQTLRVLTFVVFISRDCRLTGYFIINIWKCYLLFELPCIFKFWFCSPSMFPRSEGFSGQNHLSGCGLFQLQRLGLCWVWWDGKFIEVRIWKGGVRYYKDIFLERGRRATITRTAGEEIASR